MGLTDEFYQYGSNKTRKHSIFAIDSSLKDSTFTAVKRDANFLTRYEKRVPSVNRKQNDI